MIRLITIGTVILVLGIAVISFVLSYQALQSIAITNGIEGWLSYLWPLLIDMSLVTFSLLAISSYLQNQSTLKPWALVGTYTGMTIVFNWLHAPANLQAQIVGIIAPVSLFFSFEMLMRQLRLSVQRHEIACKIEEMDAKLQDQVEQIAKQKETITRQNAIISRKNNQIEVTETKLKPVEQLQKGKQNKITKRRQKVLALLQEGKEEKEIMQLVGVKDIRTIRADIANLNGQLQKI